ncbi:MAG: hypothetical protein FD123_3371 [Bacteroidetes bacterium]|nr:MAG: hypothetical protein FD123_3371 [Bacteroidota bacterium]
MKPVDVITEIEIACPVEKVADFSGNPDNAPRWYVNIKSVEWKTARSMTIGAQIAFQAQFLGKKLAYVYEIVEYIPNEKLVLRTADGPFPMETTYRWEQIGESRTRMILRNQGKPSGFSALFAPFMTSAMRRANRKDLQLLKSILEK